MEIDNLNYTHNLAAHSFWTENGVGGLFACARPQFKRHTYTKRGLYFQTPFLGDNEKYLKNLSKEKYIFPPLFTDASLKEKRVYDVAEYCDILLIREAIDSEPVEFQNIVNAYNDAINDGLVEARNNLALIYYQCLDEEERAKEILAPAVEVNEPYALTTLATIYYNNNEQDLYLQALQRAAKADSIQACLDLATIYVEQEKYDKAIEIFTNLKDYKDSTNKLTETKYLLAEDYVSSKKYKEAHKLFLEIEDYKDSAKKAREYKIGEFSETVSLRVGCNYGFISRYDSARSESNTVLGEMKVIYQKGVPDYQNVEIIFETYDYQGGFAGIWEKKSYKYLGEFQNGSITGKGKMYSYNSLYPTNSYLIYDGSFLNGMYNGEGSMYQSSVESQRLLIKGTWKDGNIFGEYTYYDYDGTVNDTGTVIDGIQNSQRYGRSDLRSNLSPKPDGFDS